MPSRRWFVAPAALIAILVLSVIALVSHSSKPATVAAVSPVVPDQLATTTTAAAITTSTAAATTVPTTVPPTIVTTTTQVPHTHERARSTRTARTRSSDRGVPPTAARSAASDATLAAIAECESGGDYHAENPRSTASGKYQVLDDTWDGYAGYGRASDAPPEVQEAWAREAIARSGTRPWNASRSCWGR